MYSSKDEVGEVTDFLDQGHARCTYSLHSLRRHQSNCRGTYEKIGVSMPKKKLKCIRPSAHDSTSVQFGFDKIFSFFDFQHKHKGPHTRVNLYVIRLWYIGVTKVVESCNLDLVQHSLHSTSSISRRCPAHESTSMQLVDSIQTLISL